MLWMTCIAACTAVVITPQAMGEPVDRMRPSPPVAGENAGERAVLEALGHGYRSYPTAHFLIVANCDPEQVGRLSRIAEATYDAVRLFSVELRVAAVPPSRRMMVILFDDWAGYASHARQAGLRVDRGTPGIFDEHSNRCLVFNDTGMSAPTARPEAGARSTSSGAIRPPRGDPAGSPQPGRRECQATRLVVRHEIAHQALFNLGIQKPHDRSRRWLKEGLAMQFEVGVGLNAFRLADFHEFSKTCDVAYLRHLIADPRLIGPGAGELPRAYAIAWALVRYLIAEKTEAFSRYLQDKPASNDGGGTAEQRRLRAFEAAFGSIDEVFVSELIGHVDRLEPSTPASPTSSADCED